MLERNGFAAHPRCFAYWVPETRNPAQWLGLASSVRFSRKRITLTNAQDAAWVAQYGHTQTELLLPLMLLTISPSNCIAAGNTINSHGCAQYRCDRRLRHIDSCRRVGQ
jgi:hypothetical protein